MSSYRNSGLSAEKYALKIGRHKSYIYQLLAKHGKSPRSGRMVEMKRTPRGYRAMPTPTPSPSEMNGHITVSLPNGAKLELASDNITGLRSVIAALSPQVEG